ncbi:MAG TPA: DUF11 domain-containing protein [bacterium]|nr:DUF11 domain-containing protein [bacterium]
MKKLWTLLSLTFLSIHSTQVAAQSVAIMGAPNDVVWNDEVQSKLVGTGLFDVVDVYDTQDLTPTLDEMNGYCGVLAYTDTNPLDPTAFGDNLADYVDGGGGVVAAVFAVAGIPWAGRFDTENYWVIGPDEEGGLGQQTLGTIFVPDHPILAGVTSFDGGTASYMPEDVLHPEAIRVADWSGGTIPLVATRLINGVRRADLGFFPPSTDSRDDFWVASTDGALLMANALLWVCAGSVDLVLTKSATPSPATVGTNLVYALAVTNQGPGDATGVQLTDTLPDSVSFVSASPEGLCSAAGSTVTCDLGDLAANASANVTLTVLPNSSGIVTNTASVTADQDEDNPDDNTATVETTVNPAPLNPEISGGGCSLSVRR